MKKPFSLIAIMLLMVMLLASCAPKISGRYYSGDKEKKGSCVELEFSAKKVHISMYAEETVIWQVAADYALNDDKTQITISVPTESPESAKAYSGDYSYEEAEDHIKIGLIKYYKD